MSDGPRTDSGWGQRSIHASFTPEEADEIIADLPGGHSVNPATRRFLQHLLDERRRQPPPRPLTIPGFDDGVIYAPAQAVRMEPPRKPELLWIIRKRDVTGISGVGYIGICLVAPDGAAAYRWFGGPPQDQPKWEFYDKPGTDPFEQISGHNGNTVLVPIPLEPDPEPLPEQ